MATLHPSAGVDVSNQAVARALSSASGHGVEAREAAADRVAEAAVPGTAPQPARTAGEALRTKRAPAAWGGEPLSAAELNLFGPRLGQDLSRVRVHRDESASGQADVLHSRAFTVGADIYLGTDRPADGTTAGHRLLAHELAHVVQQQSGLAVQRQEIPDELRMTPNYRDATEEELRDRHDWIMRVLGQFTESNPDTALLEQQAGEIGAELARRSALAAGRTFTDVDIERVRNYFVRNAAATTPDVCIVTLNKGLKLATANASLPTTNKSIEATMAEVVLAGYASGPREIAFLGASDQITRGAARPEKLHESVWDAVLALSGGDPGWSVFTMSLLDGYHSITLTLDASDPGKPHVYWSDQWASKGGWKEYDRDELDAEVTALVQRWWDGQAEGRKHKTVVRLWRVRATPAP